MKRKLTRKETAPPNLAAKALGHPLFRPKVEADPRAYNRRVKHKKGSVGDADLPFSAFDETGAEPRD